MFGYPDPSNGRLDGDAARIRGFHLWMIYGERLDGVKVGQGDSGGVT
jgi:hypothetical protein